MCARRVICAFRAYFCEYFQISCSGRKGKKLNLPLYIISLIEHKTKVEYNVVMQILRYMVYIWEDYEKEMAKLLRALLYNMNLPEKETEDVVSRIKERKMARLFENEKMDIFHLINRQILPKGV